MTYKEECMSIKTNLLRDLLINIIVNKLVYFEVFENINDAIAAEKKIKGWVRVKKIKLIESVNPEWRELEILR